MVTEQKTILEELIEEAPAQRERRHKLAKAKRCIGREEWDAAAELLNEIIEEYPGDEDALAELRVLKTKQEKAEESELREEERRIAQQQKKAEQRENMKGKKLAVTVVLLLVMVGAAVAAVVGISAHRQDIREQLEAENIPVADTAIIEIHGYQ